MICNNCKHKLPEDSEFCQYCGSKIENTKVTETTTDTAEPGNELNAPETTPNEALNTLLSFQAENALNTMAANADSQPSNETDSDFGLIPEKPIYTLALKSVDGEEEYLDKLYTDNGEKIKYARRGSMSVEGINGMIDIYDTFLPSGEPYKTIYINMYGAKTSTSTPQGFTFVKKVTKITPVKDKQKENTTKRFCNYCGSPINKDTKICTGCGKQYFKGIKHTLGKIFSKQHIALTIVSFILLVFVISNIALAIKVADFNRTYNINRNKIEDYEDSIDNYQDQIKDLAYYIAELENDLNFYNKYVVFVSDDGTNLYHKLNCDRFDSSSFWAYNIDAAKSQGYIRCVRCFGW